MRSSLPKSMTSIVVVENPIGQGKEVIHIQTKRITAFVEDVEMKVFTAAIPVGHKRRVNIRDFGSDI